MGRVPVALAVLAIAAQSARGDDYPLSYPDRPLALPSTDQLAAEGTALARLYRRTSYAFGDQAYYGQFLDVGARVAFSRLELSASTSLMVHQDDELDNGVYFPKDRLASAALGARLAITPDLQLGADITRLGQGELVSHYIPRVFVAARLHAAAGAAIDLTAFAANDRYSEGEPNGPNTSHITSFILGAEVRAIAQVHPSIAIEARFALTRIDPIQQDAIYGPPYTDLTEDYGLRAIHTVSRALDIIVDTDFPLEGVAQLSIGASYRWLP